MQPVQRPRDYSIVLRMVERTLPQPGGETRGGGRRWLVVSPLLYHTIKHTFHDHNEFFWIVVYVCARVEMCSYVSCHVM